MSSTNSKRLYIDIDDVLCETAGALARIVNEQFGKNFTYNDVTNFNLQHAFNLTPEQFHHMFEIFHREENILNFEPIEHAVDSVNFLFDQGHNISVVTGRPPATRAHSKQWLVKHGVRYHHLYFVDKYGRMMGFDKDPETLSLDELVKLPFDYAVEDNADMALFVSEKMKTPVLLLDCPWNRDLQQSSLSDAALITRCHGWKEVVGKINSASLIS